MPTELTSNVTSSGRDIRVFQVLLGHSKIESTVRCLGIEVDDALAIAEQVDVWSIPGAPWFRRSRVARLLTVILRAKRWSLWCQPWMRSRYVAVPHTLNLVQLAADRRHGACIMSGHDMPDFGREYLEPRRVDHVLLAVNDEHGQR